MVNQEQKGVSMEQRDLVVLSMRIATLEATVAQQSLLLKELMTKLDQANGAWYFVKLMGGISVGAAAIAVAFIEFFRR